MSSHRAAVLGSLCALTSTLAHAQPFDAGLGELPEPYANEAPTPTSESVDGGVALVRPSDVRVGDTVVFTVRAARGNRDAATRAAAANGVLNAALKGSTPNEVRVAHSADISVIYVDGVPAVQLTPTDAMLANDASLVVHADRVGAAIRQALSDERERSAVAGTIFNVSLAVLFAVLAVFLLRRAWHLGDRADVWLSAHPERVPALRLRSIEVVTPGAVRGALTLALGFSRWIVLVGIIYAWLIATFSLFEATRGLTERLTGALLSPLPALVARVAATVPLLVAVFFAVLTLGLVLRAVRLFFAEVARGATTVGWLPRDFAAATGTLAQAAIVVFALVLVAPVITGNTEGAAPRVGLLILAAGALSMVPLGAGAAVGAITIFRRRFAVEDWVEIGPRSGRIIALRLLEVTLRDDAGVEVVVPHLVRLWQPTRVHGRMQRVVATVSFEAKLLTPALRSRLEQALAQVGTAVTVRLVALGAVEATLEVALSSSTVDARSEMLWATARVLDEERRGTAT